MSTARAVIAADYGGPYAGSFIPMLRAAMLECEARGLAATAVLPERAQGRPWLSRLTGLDARFLPTSSRPRSVLWLRRLLAGEPGPTVLHTHFSRFDMPGVAAALGRSRVRIVWHTHTVLSESQTMRVANRVKLGAIGRRVDRILCVGPHLAEDVIARGARPERVSYFPNGLDIDVYAPPSPAERAAAREALGISPDATVVLHFGRDWLLKGGDLFLQAIARMRPSHPGLVAMSVWGGDPARATADELGIGDAVLTPGPAGDARPLYAAADVLLSPSRGEGALPLTVLEALAGGLRVVVSDIPGHGVPGAELPNMVVAPLDPDALAVATEEILERGAEVVERDARVARAWLERERGLETWARRVVDVYEGLASA